MTTIDLVWVTCALCGARDEVPQLMSTSSFGPCDLDTRPPPLLRQALWTEVLVCGRCGFARLEDWVFSDQAIASVVSLVGAPEYQALLRADGRPELARHFLAAALVFERLSELAHAGWCALKAAWACDDEDVFGAAVNARLRALDLWRRATAADEQFGMDRASEAAIRADVLRRTGRFDEAIDAATAALSTTAEEESVSAALSQIADLARARDAACYALADSS